MNNINIFAKVLMVMMLSIVVVSCGKDLAYDGDGQPSKDGDAWVKITINTPQSAVPRAKTRAGGVDGENIISTVKVMVFSESGAVYRFSYMVDGESLTAAADGAAFSARLVTSAQNLKLVLIVNSNQVFDSYVPSIGVSEDVVKSKLNLEFNSRLLDNLPMWGEIGLLGGLTADGNNRLSTTLLRSVSRVDVVKDLNPASHPFDLQYVYVYRANDMIQVTPNSFASGQTFVDSPSVPEASALQPYSNFIKTEIGELNNELNENGDPIQTIRKIYVPEGESNLSNKLEGVTSVIIGGYFNNGTTMTYYRVDFESKISGHPFGQILRNHKYTFNLVRVWGVGWSTPEDAARNKSTNVDVVIEKWVDFVIDMNFDSEHHFGISERKAIVGAKINSEKKLLVSTDITNYTIEWADALGVGQGGVVSLGGVLNNGVFNVVISADGESIMVTALQSNVNGATERVQYILIKANRFEILITIEQEKIVITPRAIELFSINSYLGFLGSNDPGGAVAEVRARGLRGILTNPANFGPNGVIETKGYLLSEVPGASANSLTAVYLERHDVVYLPDIASQGIVNPATAALIHTWLKATPNRFLIVCYDELNRNKNILDELGVIGTYWTSTTGPYPLVTKSVSTEYFTDNGPFTINHGLVIPPTFSFRRNDGASGEIPIAPNPTITPILTGAGGGIVLGVDYDKRVFYVGDLDMFYANTGIAGTNDNRLNNEIGTINNNASLLIANMWAYITQVVQGTLEE